MNDASRIQELETQIAMLCEWLAEWKSIAEERRQLILRIKDEMGTEIADLRRKIEAMELAGQYLMKCLAADGRRTRGVIDVMQWSNRVPSRVEPRKLRPRRS
jgi:hypothetical protein